MIFLKLLLALAIAFAIKAACFVWRFRSYGLDDPDPRRLRYQFAWAVDWMVELALMLGVYWIISAGQYQGLSLGTLYGAVFVGVLGVMLVTRCELASYGRVSEFDLQVQALTVTIESLLIALFFTLVIYPIYRYINFA